jgi:hypothetical protein
MSSGGQIFVSLDTNNFALCFFLVVMVALLSGFKVDLVNPPAAILINAPVYADQARGSSEFLKEYKAFAEKRNLQNQSAHNARFQGVLRFRNECGGLEDGCECPPGNTYLQCLVSAQTVISVDPNDIGGRGYVRVTSGTSALNANGRWVPLSERNVYSYVIEPLAKKHVIKIPVPPAQVIDDFCADNGGRAIPVSVGYGAAAPMEIEFACRIKERSGRSYDDQVYRLRLSGHGFATHAAFRMA